MKQEALEFMKANMNTLYTHYFTDDTSDWISAEYGSEAFAVFREVPDFDLCELGEKTTGEVDFENIQKLYLAMKNLTESQAAEERLWAGMCNKVFYGYLRRRWKYDENDITDAEKDASAIVSRFYFSSGVRGSYFRNSLSKYWWVGRLTYDKDRVDDQFYALKAIGSSDLNSKITEIFYNNTFASNAEILKAITDALGVFYDNKVYLPVRDVLRPTLQYLNAIGGALCLDALPSKEITKIIIEKINSLLKGDYSVLSVIDEEEDFDEDEANDIPLNAPEIVETLSFDFEFEEQVFVCKGDRVRVYIEDLNKEMVFQIPKDKERKDMKLVESYLLGKSVGDTFSLARKKYVIRDIEKQCFP